MTSRNGSHSCEDTPRRVACSKPFQLWPPGLVRGRTFMAAFKFEVQSTTASCGRVNVQRLWLCGNCLMNDS